MKKIDTTKRFSVTVPPNTKSQKKIVEIFTANAIDPFSSTSMSAWPIVSFDGRSFQGTRDRLSLHYTAEEFIKEFGTESTLALTGKIIPYKDKFYRAVDSSKGWVSDEGEACLYSDNDDSHVARSGELLGISSAKENTNYRFCVLQDDTGTSSVYRYVWVEVPAPEVPPIKEYTQEELVKLVGHDFKLKVEKK